VTRGEVWRNAKRWPGWVVLALAAVALRAVGATRDRGPQSTQERVDSIARRLACPICDGESVFESRNNASVSIRNEIEAQVTAGTRSDDEIITFIADRYEGRILLVPRATGVEALVWALPVFAAICAIGGLAFAFRRWKRAADTIPTDADRALVEGALVSAADSDSDDS
jgi:cytochrome c-type biogenesis protein CcmH